MHGLEICLGILSAKQHDADRKRNFRVDDILLEQLFADVAGEKGEVLRRAREKK